MPAFASKTARSAFGRERRCVPSVPLCAVRTGYLLQVGRVQVPAKEVIQLSGTNPRIGLTSVSGVMLEIDETRTKDWKSILEAATLIFRSAGIDTKANVGSTGSEPLAIHIFVGSKPQ